eukprot:TRINITY_DN20651_c3_g1_i1.p2 TRINITY_DN20651_c3_g1~~TRINITY_DN20651_c3_g1_i1.p2  ORF type:complete len:101 (+),score=0.29 TRINITY_DN20651_c3_g1_i1:23-304(+)
MLRSQYDNQEGFQRLCIICGAFMAFLQVACGIIVIAFMVAVIQFITNDTKGLLKLYAQNESDDYDKTVKYIGWSLWLWVASVGLGMLTSLFLC